MSEAGVFQKLVEGEVEVLDGDEFYFRQCSKGHFSEAQQQPTDQIFWAGPQDMGKLSGSRSLRATAQSAYEHRTLVLEKISMGTWAVTVDEVRKVGSRVVDDSALQKTPPPPPPPGHSYLDLRTMLDKDDRQFFRSELLVAAQNRRRAFPLDEPALFESLEQK